MEATLETLAALFVKDSEVNKVVVSIVGKDDFQVSTDFPEQSGKNKMCYFLRKNSEEIKEANILSCLQW